MKLTVLKIKLIRREYLGMLPCVSCMNGFGEEVNDELSYGILMILRIQYSIDEGMPSEVALVCFLGEFYHLLRRF